METAMSLPARPSNLQELISLAEQAKVKGDINQAILLYRHWIDSSASNDRFVALFNVGVLLADQKKYKEAEPVYLRALEIAPGFQPARINLGLLYERLGDTERAIHEWRKVASNRTEAADWVSHACTALNHIGRLLEIQKNYADAEKALYESLQLNPKQSDAIQHWYHLRQKQCKWPANYSAGVLSANEIIGSASPLATMAITDDTAIQWLAAANFVARKFKIEEQFLSNGPLAAREKIRIGYVSGDFCTHAVGLLLSELIESHNRDKFEVFGFDFSPEDGSSHRERIKKAFDYFISVKEMPDDQAALLIRRCDIDILIDLQGLSSGARPGIFAKHPSEIQIAYLGYLGTSAMPWIDYFITDRYCLTPENASHFTEKPIVVDGSAVPLLPPGADAERAKKSEFGFAEDSIVLGCFNNIYKFTPEIAKSWAKIVTSDDRAILWLLDDNQWATNNLKREFEQLGVPSKQVLFAGRCPHPEYKKRLEAIDVYLDTFPYNAGSTAWDVLAAGVPIVTLSGRSYMSRVAGSMLREAGLPELVTTQRRDYERKVIGLFDPDKRKKIKNKITRRMPKWSETPKKIIKSLEVQLEALLESKRTVKKQ